MTAARDPYTLLGRWRLDRTLVAFDGAGGSERGCVHGEVTITRAAAGPELSWHEEGLLHWAGQTYPAQRDQLLSPGADGWWMSFADGSPFHPWRPGEPVTHLCRADLYTGVIVQPAPDRLRVGWSVTGPAKDHRYDSRLRRLG